MTTIMQELMQDSSQCRICTFLLGLSQEDRAEWQKGLAFSTDSVSHSNVVRALARRGVYLTEASVRRHRRNHG